MYDLQTINQSIVEIGQLLALNKDLVQLLTDDSQDFQQEKKDYNFNKLLSEEVISLGVPLTYGVEQRFLSRNIALTVLLDQISFRDDKTEAETFIFTACDLQHVKLSNNRNRLLEINKEIVKTLQHKKLSVSGQIQITDIDSVRYADFVIGYRIRLNYINQDTERVEL